MQKGGGDTRKAGLIRADSTRQRMLANLLDQIPLPDDDPCLWPAEQFITRKTDNICPSRKGFLYGGFMAEAKPGSVNECARTEIIHQNRVGGMCQRNNILQFGLFGKTNDLEIRWVCPHDNGIRTQQGFFIIPQMDFVGRAHFHQPCT